MTERKICEYTDHFCECGDGWVPLDPQPCCATCDKTHYCEVLEKVTLPGWFYCNCWELKE